MAATTRRRTRPARRWLLFELLVPVAPPLALAGGALAVLHLHSARTALLAPMAARVERDVFSSTARLPDPGAIHA